MLVHFHIASGMRSVHATHEQKITEIAQASGFPINQSCGGKGSCSTCQIRLESGTYRIGKMSVTVLPGKHRRALACLTTPESGDCHITVPETSLIEKHGKIADNFSSAVWAALPPSEKRKGLAVAVDIGTTTVATLLLDRSTGEVLARASAYNAQIAFGDNVASRIAACADPANIVRQQQLILCETIQPLIADLLSRSGRRAEEIMQVALSGNTTMTHLAFGISPVSIGVIPFEPLLRIFPECLAGEIGLDSCPTASVAAAPAISGFVGGDIVSDIAVAGLREREGLTLLIDIGTNGEMVLAENGKMLATATAAGPAFEGAGILCGMRASLGAIEKVAISGDGDLDYSVIGECPPKGLCGTAVMDLIFWGVKRGWILSNGRFDTVRLAALGRLSSIESHGAKILAMIVVEEKDSGSGELILVTEADVAEIIKAKAAVYAGAKTLMEKRGKKWGHLDRVILAGGFAAHLDITSAIGIGLLPDLPLEKYEVIGNGSLAGACGIALHSSFIKKLEELHGWPEVINLAETDEFEDHFIDALALPHLDEEEFSNANGLATHFKNPLEQV